MFIFGNFLAAVAKILDIILVFYMWVVIARAVLSWVNPDPYNPIVRVIHSVTEPVLHPIRMKLPVNFGGLDLSPIVVFLGIMFLRTFVVPSLYDLSMKLM
jgi:YggT family protein